MPRGGKKPTFSSEQDEAIERAYAAGETTYQIAARYGTSTVPVASALGRRGVARRPGGKKQSWFATEAQVAEARDLYASGYTMQRLGSYFKTKPEYVSRALRDAGVEIRKGSGSARRIFKGDDVEKLARQYMDDGMSLASLAEQYGTNTTTISATLTRAGVTTRHPKPHFWTPDRMRWIADQYNSGRSQQEIADELGVAQATVSNRMIRAGFVVKPERRREGHHSWKGGRRVHEGYWQVMASSEDEPFLDPNRGSAYVSEHRLMMARYLGRRLLSTETVHHIDNTLYPVGPNGELVKRNDLSNLQLRQGNHGKGMVVVCGDCGSRNVVAVPLADPPSDAVLEAEFAHGDESLVLAREQFAVSAESWPDY